VLGPSSETAKVAVTEPASPSVTVTSSMESWGIPPSITARAKTIEPS
jgi:hypothetical protein